MHLISFEIKSIPYTVMAVGFNLAEGQEGVTAQWRIIGRENQEELLIHSVVRTRLSHVSWLFDIS